MDCIIPGKKIGWVITSVKGFSAIDTYDLDHCELGFIHPDEKDVLFQTLPSIKCSIGVHFPLFRFTQTIPPSTEYALVDFNGERSEFFFQQVEKNLKLIKNLNAKYLLIHMQRFFRLFSEKLSMKQNKFWDHVLEKSERLLNIQDKYNIPIVLEAICGCDFLHAPEHYEKFVLLFPQFGYCFDISHLQIDRWIYDINPGQFIDLMKSDISHVHMNNFEIPNEPFTRSHFFKYYNKIPVNLDQDRNQQHADVNAMLDILLTENYCKYFVFEQRIPPRESSCYKGIKDVIMKIRSVP